MTKKDYIDALKKFSDGAGVMTKRQLADYFGIKDQKHVCKIVKGLPCVNGKYYPINVVAERLLERTEIR